MKLDKKREQGQESKLQGEVDRFYHYSSFLELLNKMTMVVFTLGR